MKGNNRINFIRNTFLPVIPPNKTSKTSKTRQVGYRKYI